MRALTKSVIGYTWSTSLFGIQTVASFFTPQGWRQADRAAESFKRITDATSKEMGGVASATFKVGDDLQRKGTDMMFDVFTLGIFDRGEGQRTDSGAAANVSAAGTVANIGEQTLGVITQGLQTLGQTAGLVGQAIGGFASTQGCCGSSTAKTGWGPVPPPTS